jgi:DNA polymerase-3 subunit delta'
VSHAYLFCGPPQVGKTVLARTLAQALNCAQPDAPCGRCSSCSRIARDAHPDVQLVLGKGSGGKLLIEQVRALQHDAALSPFEGRYRVFILRRMERATAEACNALLKTLEEPPARVVLLLTGSQRQLLLPTIVSRCQCIELRAVTTAVIEQALEARGVEATQAGLIARLSAGRVGWAMQAAGDGSLLAQRQQDVDQLFALLAGGRVERLDAAYKISRDAAGARRLLAVWAGCGRDLILLQGSGAEQVMNRDQIERLAALAGSLSLSQAWEIVHALQQASRQIEENVNARLAIEELLLRLPYRQPAVAWDKGEVGSCPW